MSQVLDTALCCLGDQQRLRDLAANDAVMEGPRAPRRFLIEVKRGQSVRVKFSALAVSAVHATVDHLELLHEGEYLNVRPIGGAS